MLKVFIVPGSAALLMLGVSSGAAIDLGSIGNVDVSAYSGGAASVEAAVSGVSGSQSSSGSGGGSASASSGSSPTTPSTPSGGSGDSNPLIVSVNGTFVALVGSITDQVTTSAAKVVSSVTP